MQRVIITGATGVVGMAITRKCIEKGIEAVLLVNPKSPRLARIPSDPLVRVIKCGLEEFADATAERLGIESPDAFIHLSWCGTFGDTRNDKLLQEKNAAYALDAVRLAGRLGCPVFVGAGSQAEYGRVEGVLKPDTPCNPENEYGRAKLRASKETRELCHELGIRHVWPRILSIYGPYDGEKTMVMSLITQLLSGRKPSLTPGHQMWDYLYADDAGEAMLALAERGKDGGIYPIGSGVARPLREYIEIIRDLIDPSLPLGFGEVPYSDKQVMHLCADISRLHEDTGFSPKVDFAEGARRTIDWIKHQK
ncbi:MAG: NAD(P)-dependent oxidoreductase [Lachnospiraceae bacterium]|nr:NAD(P)-dependent oxidoreductase [Lachnospiraceae bacterium]